MAALDFPSSPTPGLEYENYKWDGYKWVLQVLTNDGPVYNDEDVGLKVLDINDSAVTVGQVLGIKDVGSGVKGLGWIAGGGGGGGGATLTISTTSGLTGTPTSTFDGSAAVTIAHSNVAGFKHIPSGGDTGQFLGYGGSTGTAAWVAAPQGGTGTINLSYTPSTAVITNSSGDGFTIPIATTGITDSIPRLIPLNPAIQGEYGNSTIPRYLLPISTDNVSGDHISRADHKHTSLPACTFTGVITANTDTNLLYTYCTTLMTKTYSPPSTGIGITNQSEIRTLSDALNKSITINPYNVDSNKFIFTGNLGGSYPGDSAFYVTKTTKKTWLGMSTSTGDSDTLNVDQFWDYGGIRLLYSPVINSIFVPDTGSTRLSTCTVISSRNCDIPSDASYHNGSSIVCSRSLITRQQIGETYTLMLGYSADDIKHVNNRTIVLRASSGVINTRGAITAGNGSTDVDYVEYFENGEGTEILPGTLVTLNGDVVNIANLGDEIGGVVSHTGGIKLGDTLFCWQGRYLTDEWGQDIMEDILDPDWESEIDDPNYKLHILDPNWESEIDDPENPGQMIPNPEQQQLIPNSEPITKVPNPIPQQLISVQKENPDYNIDQEQTPRSERPDEWTPVGLLGQVRVRVDETVTVNSRIKAGNNGIGTLSTEKTGLRCMRINQPFDAGLGYAIAYCFINVMA